MIKRGTRYNDIYNYRNLIVAEKIACTEKYKYITIDDIARELRDGTKGVSGVGANGKMKKE